MRYRSAKEAGHVHEGKITSVVCRDNGSRSSYVCRTQSARRGEAVDPENGGGIHSCMAEVGRFRSTTTAGQWSCVSTINIDLYVQH